jgi:predicted house-cleaning noncanonical NTP pyrophosphatase (MazG superfamily)
VNEKLVRDRIPERIRANGELCVLDQHYRKAQPEEMRELLVAKLHEETDEIARAPSRLAIVEELADLTEVIRHLGEIHGIEPVEIERARRDKSNERGSFYDRIVLFGDKE